MDVVDQVQAADNAKRLNDGDLDNLELVKGPGEANRRRTVLNQVWMTRNQHPS